MEGFKKINKEIFKIMWLPGEDEIVFRAKDESPLALSSELYLQLAKYFDIDSWKSRYALAYKRWLEDDNNSVYDINDDVNLSMIDALVRLNKDLDSQALYYWFDIDRTFSEEFTWKYCPISGRKLICLGDEYTKKNAFISPVYPLIFPDYERLL